MKKQSSSVEILLKRHNLPQPSDLKKSLPVAIRFVQVTEFPFLWQRDFVLFVLKGLLNGQIPPVRYAHPNKDTNTARTPKFDHYVVDEASPYFGKRCGILLSFPATRTFEVMFEDKTTVRLPRAAVVFAPENQKTEGTPN